MRSLAQKKCISVHLDRFCFVVSVRIPISHWLSTSIGVGGYGCPISIKAVRIDTHSWQLLNTAAISASVADDITFAMMEHMIWTALFQGGGGSVLGASFRLVDGFMGVSQLSDGMTMER